MPAASVLWPLAALPVAILTLGIAIRSERHLKRLAVETAQLKAVVEQSSDGILVLDGLGRVLVWNPAMSQITGESDESALGVPLGWVITAVNADGVGLDPTAVLADLTPQTPRLTTELGVVRPDGEQRWIQCEHAAMFEGSTLVHDVVTVHDVTREREVDRMKSDFVAMVTHELRTPLTPLKGYADLLRRRGNELAPEKRSECLDIIADRVAHLSRLVEDLLLASRITSSAPQHDLRVGVHDLRLVAERAAADFADRGRLRLHLPETPVDVTCDVGRAVQIIGNLLSNALKYSDDGSTVDVTVSAHDGQAALSVADNGRGIPNDQLEPIFDKFHRVENPLRMTTGGTGLGLYVARQLATAMDGAVEVHSLLGIGSTFTLTLPLAARVPAPRAAAEDRTSSTAVSPIAQERH